MLAKGGKQLYGQPIGIVLLDVKYPLIPGNVGNASTYDFPVRIKIIRNLHDNPFPPIYNESGNYTADVIKFIVTIKELEEEGVRAIVASCGFFSLLQEIAVKEVGIPVFTSPLMFIPVIHRMIHPNKKIGIITASAQRLTRSYLEPVGVDEPTSLIIEGLDDSKEFNEVIMQGQRDTLDINLLKNEVIHVAEKLIQHHPDIGAVLIECSDLPPFSADIQEAVRLPVFDYICFINSIYHAVVQKRYTGII
jgi:hypothetical protein